MACIELCRVLCIKDRLKRAANMGRPRGSIDEFSFNEIAYALEVSPAEVERTYRAMVAIGEIDQWHWVRWDDEQPDREDATVTSRMKRYRARQKEQRIQQQSYAVTSVTLRPDSDSDKKERGAFFDEFDRAEAFAAEQRKKQLVLPVGPVVVKQRGGR